MASDTASADGAGTPATWVSAGSPRGHRATAPAINATTTSAAPPIRPNLSRLLPAEVVGRIAIMVGPMVIWVPPPRQAPRSWSSSRADW